MRDAKKLMIEISPGELLDRISILRIKARRLRDSGLLGQVQAELDALELVRKTCWRGCEEIGALESELRQVNEALWDVEDDLRGCEAAGEFGRRFVDLARSVYRYNDRRSHLKRRIDELAGSNIVEIKSYGHRPAAAVM